MSRPRLVVEDLSKVYSDGKVALERVSFEFEKGMVGLLGPNGAGKSTLLGMLALELEPSSGSVRLDELLAADPNHQPEYRRRLGYLAQFFAPIGYLSGREYLGHVAVLRGLGRRVVRDRVEYLLEAVGLQEAAHRRCGEYSGGMKRRLGLAQAMLHEPRVLIADEPTAGLDPEERIRLRNLLTDVAADAVVVLSTHIVEDIEATCSRLVVIAQGQVAFDNTAAALLRRSAGSATLEQAYEDLLAETRPA